MKIRRKGWLAGAIVLMSWLGASVANGGPPPRPDSEGVERRAENTSELGMSSAVACVSIEGYDDYEPLPGAALSSEEKLLVYYRPFGYHVQHSASFYRVHLSQDGQIRRRGEKRVLQRKEKLVDYEHTSKEAPTPRYMKNIISMKGLAPGEYDLDIILHDELTGRPPVTQVLPFRIVPPGPRKEGGEEGRSRDRPASP